MFSSRRILYVDDSKDDCELLRIMLTENGYAVKTVPSSTEALQLIRNNLFDLCLSDLSLSEGTGIELLEKVRAINPFIPLIICSADVRESTQEEALQAGADAFFTKPVDFDLLMKTIAQFLKDPRLV